MSQARHQVVPNGLSSYHAQDSGTEQVQITAAHGSPVGHAIGETGGQVVPFLTLIGANATSTTDTSNPQPA
jgi:hypothetical protein